MFYKLSTISIFIILCGCSVNKTAINDSCSEFRNQLSFNIDGLNDAQSKKDTKATDFYFYNINHLFQICSTKVTDYGDKDNLIAQARVIFKQRQDLQEEICNQEAKVKAEKELSYNTCREKYLKRVENVKKVTEDLNNNLKFVNNTGFKLPPQDITVSTDMEVATNVCPDENSDLLNYLHFSRKNRPNESSTIDYNISLNVGNSTNLFKDSLHIAYDYKKYISEKPIVIVNTNSINYTLGMIPYSNSDKYIKLSYDDKGISITNESDKFITISEIWFYFDNDISKSYLTDLSLPPESFKNNIEIRISDKMRANMIFKNITKSKASEIKLKVGFAVKYKLENSNIENTLYKVKSSTLAESIVF